MRFLHNKVSEVCVATLNLVSNTVSYYRPQRSWGKVIFFEMCVKNSVHRGTLPHCMLGYTPPPKAEVDPPLGLDPLGSGTPHPRDKRQAPPKTRPPQRSACLETWATSRRYASYWSAILLACCQ